MDESKWQAVYREEARLLAKIGAELERQDFPSIEVRLPRALAEAALATWRGDYETESTATENYEQYTYRHRAAAFSLIGLTIENSGRWDADEMIVSLQPDLIGEALAAADELRDPE